jgi:hypothetical protein
MGFQAFLADNVTCFIGHIALSDDYAWNPMMRILLALALGTLPMTVLVWRELVRERRDWQREQTWRQDRLMRVDVQACTDGVAWS